MGDPKGFINTRRETPKRRPVDLRLMDWREVYEPFETNKLKLQDNIVTNPYKDDDGQQELDYLTFHSLTENELSDWVKLF